VDPAHDAGELSTDGEPATARSRLRIQLLVALFATLTVAVLQLALAQTGSAAPGDPCPQTGMETVSTDAADYPPGSTVHISGTGYASDCDVRVEISRPDTVVDTATVTTDLFGNISHDYLLPPPPGVIGDYRLNVVGYAEVILASTGFTDGGPKVNKLFRNAGLTDEAYQYALGETTFAQATNLNASFGYKLEVFNASNASVHLSACLTGATTATDSYTPVTLSNATAFRWVLHEWTSSTCASGAQGEDADNTLAFNVAQATAYTSSALTTPTTTYAGGATAFVVVNGMAGANWSTTWVAPGVGVNCANTSGGDRPDADVNGKLPSTFLAYPPNETFADDWNKAPSKYESTTCPAFASANEGQWKVTLAMDTTHSVTLNAFTVDTTGPSVTINQAATQADPTNTSPIHFTATFSEPVTGFTGTDLSFTGSTSAGTKTATVTEIAPNNGTTYDVSVAITGATPDGTVIASIPAGSNSPSSAGAQDAAGNGNAASTSSDNSVTYDTTKPSVTINQAGTQSDPTSASPINFTVVFSESVTGFAAADVSLSGSAGATTANVTGSGTTYNVAVSGMTSDGTVIATIPAGSDSPSASGAQDAAGNGNTASTSTDHTVTYDTTGPVTSNTAVAPTPTNSAPTVTATETDATSNVAAAEFFIDVAGANGSGTAMNASDASFNNGTENVTKALTTTQFNALSEGSHTIYVHGQDAAGNWGSTQSATFFKDTVKPTSSASSPTYATSTSITVDYVSGDASPSSGVSKVELYAKAPGAGSYSLAGTDTTPSASGESFAFTATVDGSYDFYTVAYDNAGNVEAAPATADDSTLVDTEFPTSSASSPAYSTSASFTVSYTDSDPLKNSSNSGVADVELWAKTPGGSFAKVATDTGAGIDGSFSFSGTIDGSYSFYTRAHDKAGNYEAAPATADSSTLVDTQQPNSQITFPVNNGDYNTSTFSAGCSSATADICGTASDPLKNSSNSGLDKVELSIRQQSSGLYWDGAGFTSASESWNLASGTGSWSYDFATPPEGTYTIHSRATDNAGRVESSFDTASFNEVHVNIDNTAPSSSVSFPANNAKLTTANYNAGCGGATPDVCGSASDAGTSPSGVDKVEVSIQRASDSNYWNGSAWQAGAAWNLASGTTSWSYGFSPAADESYTVVSRATDKATNAETPGSGISFLIDDAAPSSSASSPDYSTSTSITVTYSASDPGFFPSGLADVELWAKTPGGSFTKVATDAGVGIDNSFSFTGTVDGSYEFYTRAHDNAGNYEAAPATADDSTLVDTEFPTSSASSPTYSTSTSVTVTYSASDPLKNGSNSGLDKVELYAHTPGIAGYALAGTDNSPDTTQSFSFTGTVDGSYDFYTVAYDKAGNVEAAPGSPDDSTLVDTEKPISSASVPNYETSASFSVSYTASDPLKNSSASGLDKVELYVDTPAVGGYTLYATDSGAGIDNTFSYTALAGDGDYSFYTVAYDKAGNVEASPTTDSDTTKLDTQDPNSVITFPANGGSYNASTFQAGCGTSGTDDICGTADDPLKNASKSGLNKVEVSIKQQSSGKYWDGSAFTSPTEMFVLAAGTDNWSYDFGTPPEGQYTIHSKATDNAGNAETSFGTTTFNEVGFQIDTTKPDVTIDQASGQNDPTDASPINFTVVFSESVTGFAGSDVTLSGTAGATTAVVTGSGTTYNVAVSGMTSDGTVIASVPAGGAQDAASNTNNASTSTDHTVTYDTTGPVTSGTAVNQSPTSSAPTVTATEHDALSKVSAAEYFIDAVGANGSGSAMSASDASFDSGTEGVTATLTLAEFAGLGQGTHTIYVHGKDQLGHWGATDSVTFVKDTIGPVTSATAVSPTPTKSEPTVSATETDATSNVAAAEFFIDDASCTNGSGTAMNASDLSFDSSHESVTQSLTFTQFDVLSEGTHTIYVHGKDAAGNWGACQSATFVKDTMGPDVSINQKVGQADPTNVSPIHFTAVFNEPVTGFDSGDVSITGTAGGTMTVTITEIAPNDGTTYDVAVSGMTTDGTVIASIPAGGASDAATNGNFASTSTDHTVTWKASKPSVTIDQAAGQNDPTNSAPINFTAVFSESVSGFDGTDVNITGTAGGTKTVVVTGGPTTYNVAVSGMTSDGTVIADIAAGGATDSVGNTNTASTSTDHTVTYDHTNPNVTIDQASGQNDPTNSSPINFTATFDGPVSGFTDSDVTITGTAGGSKTVTVSGGPTVYNVAVSGMTSDGTVIASIAANGASDTAGNGNNTSTSTDNSVTYDTNGPSVTINQAATQTDPTSTAPIHFTAVFSEPVSGFTNTDVTVTGTAGATAANVYQLAPMDGTTWDVRVNGMTTAGTVIADIGANKAQDAAGNDNAASTSVDHTVTWQPTAGNSTPVVTIISPPFGSVYAKGSAAINPLTVKASFSDPDNGPWTYTINWDDNGAVSSGSATPAPSTFQATHPYVNPGVYTINVCVKDSTGTNGCASVWIVVYDPNGGFVTGGGFINVNAGSYAGDPLLTGRANFGFNSQYKKNANIPTGETEFTFQVGNLNFHSEAYNWLVVSGYKAQYKGTGSVNGVPGYDFTLTAYDGDITGGGGMDKFRIRITKTNNGNVVFDNKNGTPTDMDVADPQTIAGGSIVIHKA
jgi:hypothetical protein